MLSCSSPTTPPYPHNHTQQQHQHQVVPHVGDPKTWASRILVLGYAFMVLIMVHLFTGEFLMSY